LYENHGLSSYHMDIFANISIKAFEKGTQTFLSPNYAYVFFRNLQIKQVTSLLSFCINLLLSPLPCIYYLTGIWKSTDHLNLPISPAYSLNWTHEVGIKWVKVFIITALASCMRGQRHKSQYCTQHIHYICVWGRPQL
jgi:hypothetical protein